MPLATRFASPLRFRAASVRRAALTWGALALGLAAYWHGGVGSLGLRLPVAGYSSAVTPPHRTTIRSLAHRLVRSLSSTARSSLFQFSNPSHLASGIMPTLTPPHPAPKWTHTAEEIIALTKEAIVRDRALEDRVVALPADECNFETVSCDRRLLLLIFFPCAQRRILCG